MHSLTSAGLVATQGEHPPAHKPACPEAYEATLLSKTVHIWPLPLAISHTAVIESQGHGAILYESNIHRDYHVIVVRC